MHKNSSQVQARSIVTQPFTERQHFAKVLDKECRLSSKEHAPSITGRLSSNAMLNQFSSMQFAKRVL